MARLARKLFMVRVSEVATTRLSAPPIDTGRLRIHTVCMPKANNQVAEIPAAGPGGPAPGTAFNLNRLVYFAAVVDCGSFTRAAAHLGVTKAVVSQQIAR